MFKAAYYGLAMGFPTDFFPVLFAIPRVVGWLAHWKESMEEQPAPKIWRPRQLYVGPSTRDYHPMEERSVAKSLNGDSKVLPSIDSHPFNRRYVVSTRSKL